MRRAILTGLVAIVLTGCSQFPTGAESPSPASEAATGSPPAPSTTPEAASPDPATPTPPPSAPTPTELSALPDGLNAFAWARTNLIMDTTGEPASTTVSLGTLGSTASFVSTIPRTDGYVRTFAEGSLVAVLVSSDDRAIVDVHDARDGTTVARAAFDGWVSGLGFDPDRGQIYASTQSAGGDVEIRRVRFDATDANALIRFHIDTPTSNIPQEPYGFALTPSGTLVAIACTEADGCRIWIATPDQEVGQPMTLPASIPRICWVVDATDDWLLVEDIATCEADAGGMPLPLRAISLKDASTQLLNEGPNFLPGRLAEVDRRTVVLASTRSDDWSTSNIVAMDVKGGERRTLLSALPNDQDGLTGWYGVDRQRLVDPWILVQTWGVDGMSGKEPPNARLLNASSGQVIELAGGTFGWH